MSPTLELQSSNGVSITRETEIVPSTPMTLLERAVTAGASIEQVEKLIALQERWEANEARKAYYAAMAEFKKDAPKILKNKHVDFTGKTGIRTQYDHATLDHVCDRIVAKLSDVGITHKWIPKQVNGRIHVTCLLTHALGFSDPEPPTLEGPPDESGNKGPVQAIGSTVTFLERYTLLAAVGLATGGRDGDASPEPQRQQMPEDELISRLDAIGGAADNDQLQDFYLKSMKAARDLGDKSAEDDLVKAKNKRYRELNGTVRNATR